MTENRVAEKVIGVALDGTGYGEDGNIWGFELLVADLTGFERMGHLKPIPAPGGDRAAREPWRMATSYLFSVFGEDFDERWKKEETEMLFAMIKKSINSPLTSSCGRLFDAVSAILGLCERAEYEAEAAIALERVAEDSVDGEYKYEIKEGDLLVIDPSLTIRGVVEDVDHRVREGVISAKFHNTLSKMVADLCTKIRDKTKIEKIALSGGCFQNLYLKKRVKKVLKDLGFSVYLHNTVPTHDGGISLGQAVVAGRCV
jgi:hydrogenase maturation protein HypF